MCLICLQAGRNWAPEPQAYTDAADRGGGALGGKASFTPSQAAEHLIRPGQSWSPRGEGTTVTYAYASVCPASADPSAPWSAFTAPQIAATELALRSWADVANIVFRRVDPTGSGYADDATMLFSNYTRDTQFGSAYAYYPEATRDASGFGGDVYVNTVRPWNTAPAPGSRGQLILVHEIGHAIGIAHPGAYNGGSGSVTYANGAEYYEDTTQYSVMSYFDERQTGANFNGFAPSAPQLDDIAAVQRLYGANMSTRVGDTVYGFGSTAVLPWFSAADAKAPLVFAVWDAGGADTFDFSLYVQDQKIDLSPGHFSDVGGLVGNVAVAAGVVIENAYGGGGADRITGNAAANGLQGQGGADLIDGAGGDDFLLGGAGDDRVSGGEGADLLGGEAGADVLNGGGGGDQLYGGADADVLFGEDGLDRLTGQDGDDVLGGNGGWDVLHGGAGSDRFLIFSTGDSDRFNADIILDFAAGFDRLDLGFIDADATQVGDQAFRWVGFSQQATDVGTLRIGFVDGVGVYLYGHTDADDSPDLMINIGTFAIGAGDLIL